MPLKSVGNGQLLICRYWPGERCFGDPDKCGAVDGQHSVYLPILKQGGDGSTIAVVNGVRTAIGKLLDVPKALVTEVVFDQSAFVKTAIANLGSEGGIGLVLTA